MPGKFITVEGGEGVGKSSFIAGLQEWLRKGQRSEVVVTREPGGTFIADQLRQLFVEPPKEESWTIEAECLVVYAARAQHVKHVIAPALDKGAWVLCDRFSDSSRVIQGMVGGVPLEAIDAIDRIATYGRSPDLTFILDCPPEITLPRLQERSRLEGKDGSRYDNAGVDFHAKVRQSFLDLGKKHPERMVVVDANRRVEQVVENGIEVLKQRLGMHG